MAPAPDDQPLVSGSARVVRSRMPAAVVVNGISSTHRDYLAAGGLGFILGHGRLSYGPETILELYYKARLAKSLFLAVDH